MTFALRVTACSYLAAVFALVKDKPPVLGNNAVLADCSGIPADASSWGFRNQTIDNLQATNLLLMKPGSSTEPAQQSLILNCPGTGQCHAWGPSFNDRNGVLQIASGGSIAGTFRMQSWPVTKSLPVNKGQTAPGQCTQPVGNA